VRETQALLSRAPRAQAPAGLAEAVRRRAEAVQRERALRTNGALALPRPYWVTALGRAAAAMAIIAAGLFGYSHLRPGRVVSESDELGEFVRFCLNAEQAPPASIRAGEDMPLSLPLEQASN